MIRSSKTIIDLRTKVKDFCTEILIGIDEEILNFFIDEDEEEDIELCQEKAYLLVAYTYNWFFGLRNKRLEEQIFGLRNKVLQFRRIVLSNNAEIMEFLQNIWKCYGDLSIEELEKMQAEEIKVCKQSIPHHYYAVHYDLHEGTVIGETKLQLCTMSFPEYPDYSQVYYFHSMENEKIGDYLPSNVVVKLSNDGLPEIVKLEPVVVKLSNGGLPEIVKLESCR